MESVNRRHVESRVQTLVENQNVFHSEASELNMFETYKVAKEVDLTFDYPVIVSMLHGKKVMHINDMDKFAFYPGETIVLPTGQEMIIDFPEASFETPTQCLALGIEPSLIRETVYHFNNKLKIENDPLLDLNITKTPSSVHNQQEIQHLINRITLTFVNQNSSRDMLLDLMLKELIVRLLQTEARTNILLATQDIYNNNRIAFVVRYIKKHLTEKLSVNELANKAYMSPSHFHRIFKNAMGETPIAFILKERVRFAIKLMENSNLSISQIASLTGFNNAAYFTRQFKRLMKKSPQQYRNQNKLFKK